MLLFCMFNGKLTFYLFYFFIIFFPNIEVFQMVSSHLQQLGKSPHNLSKVRSPPRWPPQLALIAGVFLGQAPPYNKILSQLVYFDY